MSAWIDVRDRLPDYRYRAQDQEDRDNPPISIDTLFVGGDGEIYLGHLDYYSFDAGSDTGAEWWSESGGYVSHITHWMPLPEAPK